MLHHHADFVSATVQDRVRTAQREARAAVAAGVPSAGAARPSLAPARPRSLLAVLLRRPRPRPT